MRKVSVLARKHPSQLFRKNTDGFSKIIFRKSLRIYADFLSMLHGPPSRRNQLLPQVPCMMNLQLARCVTTNDDHMFHRSHEFRVAESVAEFKARKHSLTQMQGHDPCLAEVIGVRGILPRFHPCEFKDRPIRTAKPAVPENHPESGGRGASHGGGCLWGAGGWWSPPCPVAHRAGDGNLLSM